jgi:lipopolysaccharide/colanic/teichoic acid biosynthesis glycosyltransferase/dTDP-glucose pyrophosphorylase
MKAVVLAGNAGTKLLPLTQSVPKPLLPVANTPLALHIVHLLKRSGFADLIFCLTPETTALMKVLGNGEAWQVCIRYVVEERPLGTGGALGQLAALLSHEPFLVMGSNLLFNYDLRELVAQHRRTAAAATLLIAPNVAEHGEIVEISKSGAVLRILRGEGLQETSRFFAVGVYCFDPVIFRFFRPEEKFLDIKEQLVSRLLEAGMPVASQELTGNWQYLYGVEDYVKMNWDILAGRLESAALPESASQLWIGAKVRFGQEVSLTPPVLIGDNTIVQDGAQSIGPMTIGANCVIGKNVKLKHSVMWNEGVMADASAVQRCVITGGGQVEGAQQISDAVVVKQQPPSAITNLLEKSFKITAIVASHHEVFSTARRRKIFEGMKRTIDVINALLCLAIFLPLMGLIALAIKVDSPGPILFRRRRCGLNGKEFFMFKFRSMVQDAAQRQEQLRHLNQQDGPIFKINDDPRLTRIGRFLRKSSLDELPQLFNILRGEMSFVGPRPLASKELRFNPFWSEIRQRVKPGLTGLWQSNGRSNVNFSDWVTADTQYVMHQSLALDLKILLKTPLKVLLSEGAC